MSNNSSNIISQVIASGGVFGAMFAAGRAGAQTNRDAVEAGRLRAVLARAGAEPGEDYTKTMTVTQLRAVASDYGIAT